MDILKNTICEFDIQITIDLLTKRLNSLTQLLSKQYHKVISFEIDYEICEALGYYPPVEYLIDKDLIVKYKSHQLKVNTDDFHISILSGFNKSEQCQAIKSIISRQIQNEGILWQVLNHYRSAYRLEVIPIQKSLEVAKKYQNNYGKNH